MKETVTLPLRKKSPHQIDFETNQTVDVPKSGMISPKSDHYQLEYFVMT